MHLNNPSGKLKPIEFTDAIRTDVEFGGGETCETTIETVRSTNNGPSGGAHSVNSIQWICHETI